MAQPELTQDQLVLLGDCFRKIDADNNGVLDAAEIDEFLRKTFPDADDETLVSVRHVVFHQGDNNQDGKIDLSEFLSLISQRQYEAVLAALASHEAADNAADSAEALGDPHVESILANLDPEEIDMLRDAFIRLDADGDGFVGREELKSGVQAVLRERFDTAWEYLAKIFDVADRDQDDKLSIFEFLSSFADGPGAVPREVIVECVARVRVRLSDQELEDLRERFCEIDKNQDGYIDREELLAAMRELLAAKYPDMNEQNFEEIVSVVMATADSDQDGRLNLSEFIRSYQEDQGVLPAAFMGRTAAVRRKLTPDEVSSLKDAFSTLDENNDGFVDYTELYGAVMQALSQSNLTDTDARDIVDAIMLTADRNNDGKLSLTEFIRNFVEHEELMAVPITAADERRAAAKERIENMIDSGDLYKMIKLFSYLDTNQDGFLQREELFGLLFRSLSEWYPNWTDDQKYQAIDLIIEGADVDGDGRISIDEFVHSYVAGYGILPTEVVREIGGHLRRRLSDEEMQKVRDSFAVMDANGDGFVSNTELKNALSQALGSVIESEVQLDEIVSFILSKVDTDRDGRISLKEFILSCELDQDLLPVLEEAANAEGAPEEVAPVEAVAEAAAPAAAADAEPVANTTPAATAEAAPVAETAPTEATPVAKTDAPQNAEPSNVVAAPVASTPSPSRAQRSAASPFNNDVSGVCITDEQFREQFNKYDTDGSGFLNKAEFKRAFLGLEWCGLPPSNSDFEKMFSRICQGDDRVSYDEFCLFMLQRSRM